jgi:2-polyprenyl-6-methoxyphenol hydroxylase-like FAD-dependent oxidoreductase
MAIRLLALAMNQRQVGAAQVKETISYPEGGRMTSIVVCGGGVIGIAAALLLARDGHQLTVLEANPDPPPEDPAAAWAAWSRSGVAQFRQPHILLPGFRETLRNELPDLLDRLAEAGCVSTTILEPMPPGITDREPRSGDERLQNIAGRRPVVEAVFAAAAAEEPGVTVRRGVRATGLLTGPPLVPGTPQVSGVRTDDGAELRADLVVDAMGRRTPSGSWLTAVGGREPEVETEDNGFVYYSRFFAGPQLPVRRAPAVSPIGSFSLLTLPGDGDTWSVTVYGMSNDAELKAVRDPECFRRLLQACPAHAQWLGGTPLTGVLAMAGVTDRYRRFVLDGVPVVTGFAAVGDAWACTNPSAGRGLSLGLIQARVLRDAVRQQPGDPVAFQLSLDQSTQQQVTPFYRSQLAIDRARAAEISAIRDGVDPPPGDPLRAGLMRTAGHDADVFRALIEMLGCLTRPEDVFARPGFVAGLDEPGEIPGMPGPDRKELLELLAG